MEKLIFEIWILFVIWILILGNYLEIKESLKSVIGSIVEGCHLSVFLKYRWHKLSIIYNLIFQKVFLIPGPIY